MDRYHTEQLAELMAATPCLKGHGCIRSDFEIAGEVTYAAGGHVIFCRKEKGKECRYGMTYGEAVVCTCPSAGTPPPVWAGSPPATCPPAPWPTSSHRPQHRPSSGCCSKRDAGSIDTMVVRLEHDTAGTLRDDPGKGPRDLPRERNARQTQGRGLCSDNRPPCPSGHRLLHTCRCNGCTPNLPKPPRPCKPNVQPPPPKSRPNCPPPHPTNPSPYPLGCLTT